VADGEPGATRREGQREKSPGGRGPDGSRTGRGNLSAITLHQGGASKCPSHAPARLRRGYAITID